jgi:hypothetical protein
MRITSKTVALVAVEVDGKLSSASILPGRGKYEFDLYNDRTYEDLRLLSEDMGLIEIRGGLPSKETLAELKAKRERAAKAKKAATEPVKKVPRKQPKKEDGKG